VGGLAGTVLCQWHFRTTLSTNLENQQSRAKSLLFVNALLLQYINRKIGTRPSVSNNLTMDLEE
jgi:hypothetical protein